MKRKNIIIEKEKEVDNETEEIKNMISEVKVLETTNEEEYLKLSSIILERKKKLNLLIDELVELIKNSKFDIVDEYWSWVCSLEN